MKAGEKKQRLVWDLNVLLPCMHASIFFLGHGKSSWAKGFRLLEGVIKNIEEDIEIYKEENLKKGGCYLRNRI